jgi:hypothetical protein
VTPCRAGPCLRRCCLPEKITGSQDFSSCRKAVYKKIQFSFLRELFAGEDHFRKPRLDGLNSLNPVCANVYTGTKLQVFTGVKLQVPVKIK